MRIIHNFIDGSSALREDASMGDVFDPNLGRVQAQVALADVALVDAAVASAKQAQPSWAALNPQRRARVMFDFKALIESHMGRVGAPAFVRAWQSR